MTQRAAPAGGCRGGGTTARYKRRDEYYQRAREQGYRSRAAYKLEDLLRRWPFLRPGAAVVDLGCWPGSWLQVLAERVGPEGLVVGVDIRDTAPIGGPVRVLTLDFTEAEAPQRIEAALGRPASLVLSDAAPRLGGIVDVDRGALEDLYAGALRVAERVLDPRGCLVVKGFPGPPADAFRDRLRGRFAAVSEVRPEGKRSSSKEFYWLATPERPGVSGPGRGRRPRR